MTLTWCIILLKNATTFSKQLHCTCRHPHECSQEHNWTITSLSLSHSTGVKRTVLMEDNGFAPSHWFDEEQISIQHTMFCHCTNVQSHWPHVHISHSVNDVVLTLAYVWVIGCRCPLLGVYAALCWDTLVDCPSLKFDVSSASVLFYQASRVMTSYICNEGWTSSPLDSSWFCHLLNMLTIEFLEHLKSSSWACGS